MRVGDTCYRMDDDDGEFTRQEKKALKQVANGVIDRWPSRRDALKMGAVGVAAAGLGSGATGAVMADASESDSDGDVGTTSNRVDVFSDGVDANSVTAAQIATDQGLTIEEDDNSPFTFSGSQSGTFTLAGSYSVVVVYIEKFLNTSGAGQALEAQVNGVTTGYNYRQSGGGYTSAVSAWPIATNSNDGGGVNGVVRFSGNWSERAGVMGNDVYPSGNHDTIIWGTVDSATSPLNSITFQGGSGTVDVHARVVGVSL